MIDTFTLYFFRSFCCIVRILPEKLGRALCLGLVKIIIQLMARSKSVALLNISKCFPENNIEQNLGIYHSSLRVLADNIYMFCLLPLIGREFSEKHIDANSFLENYHNLSTKSEHKSVIFVTAHFGCFELMAHLSALKNVPVSILSRQLNLPKTEKWWNSIRELNGNEVFARKGGYKETISRLKSGKNVAILCDQNVKANYAIFVKLFGITAASTITIGHAVHATSAPVIFVALAKRKDGTYKLLSKVIESPKNKENIEEFTIELMNNYHQALEEAVREFPDHWFWFHRRFKTRPKGEKEDFYESVDNS